MPYRDLGSTGERVSAIGIGGWHLGLKHVDEPLSIRIVRTAVEMTKIEGRSKAAAATQLRPALFGR
jgi:hypothetical protein